MERSYIDRGDVYSDGGAASRIYYKTSAAVDNVEKKYGALITVERTSRNIIIIIIITTVIIISIVFMVLCIIPAAFMYTSFLYVHRYTL